MGVDDITKAAAAQAAEKAAAPEQEVRLTAVDGANGKKLWHIDGHGGGMISSPDWFLPAEPYLFKVSENKVASVIKELDAKRSGKAETLLSAFSMEDGGKSWNHLAKGGVRQAIVSKDGDAVYMLGYETPAEGLLAKPRHNYLSKVSAR